MRDKSTFIAWLSSFPEIYNSREVFSALTELNEYYYSITKCKCNVLDLKEAEIQRLFDELRTDFFYARNHPQVHRKMLIILRLFREYQEYKKNAHYTCSHVRKMLSELHECCLGINRTKEAEERKKREFEILNTKPEVTIVYPKSYDRPFQPLPIKEVPSQGSSHTKGKKEKPGKYYRYFKNAKSLRTRSLSFQKDYHVVIDPLFSEIDNSDNSYDFSSWKWIYDEILRRAPALTPFVNEVRKLPRPKAGEIKLLIRQYQIGNLSALNNLLPYFYRICLKSALKVSIKLHTDLEETVCEANLQLLTLLPKLIAKENRIGYLSISLEQNLSRGLSPEWIYFPLTHNERDRAIITREILDNTIPDCSDISCIPSEVKDQIAIAFSRKIVNPDSFVREALQNTFIQDIWSLEKCLSLFEAGCYLRISEYELLHYYDFRNENEDIELLIPVFEDICLADFIEANDDFLENIVLTDKLFFALSNMPLSSS